MKPIGDIDYVVGLKVERDRGHKTLKLNQETEAKRVLERFGMTNYWPIACSVAPNATVKAHEGPTTEFPYSQAVGFVMYLAMDTRPDLAFSVWLVSHFVINQGEVHVQAVKRILRYFCAMTKIGLSFGGSNN